ncbi:PPC domain-containing DNA-binding protein [Shinella oryzae]|uniref:DNA-binding protein n=1 Tax=Shinella oryzae TaxID=2871820 RepID=A0ABY9KEJ8_9HYPH|nr:PPC domain-containing DNA-binding protein [Shinella oryzae]WLS06214.1 DNA-binding protein [Shinella oryzae]
MKNKLLANDAGERTFILILEEGDEAFACLTAFAQQERITAASVTAIGAFRSATIAFFEFETKNYKRIPVEVQSEVLTLMGDIAVDDEGKASLHLHVVLGLSDGSTRGGRFLEGHVQPTLEVVVRETPAKLRRRRRAELGIALIDIDQA